MNNTNGLFGVKISSPRARTVRTHQALSGTYKQLTIILGCSLLWLPGKKFLVSMRSLHHFLLKPIYHHRAVGKLHHEAVNPE